MKKLNFSIKDGVLSFQHMFAMLGATILVPILANMSIPATLLSAGIGTIAFYFITQKKVPVFLGSSFAFLPALMTLVGTTTKYSTEWQNAMANVSLAIFIAGLVYVGFSLIIKAVGVEKVKKLFPPIVVGPVIIIIGMVLVPKMFWNNIIGNYDTTYGWGAFMAPGVAVAWKQWTTAVITALAIVLINALAKPKSFLKVVPILLGFIIGYLYSLAIGLIDYSGAFSADRIVLFQNFTQEFSFYKGFANLTGGSVGTAILMIVPLAVVTFMEHIGDINANSAVCGKDFMLDPGVNKTVLGDGVATMIGAVLGGPANTTYGENTAVLAITQNYNPRNIFVAACCAVVIGIFTIFSDFIATIPSAVIGGASIVLFGMISASGLRTLIEAKVDFNDSKNTIILSVVLAVGLGLGSMSLAGDITGSESLKIMAGDVEISPLAIATFLGIILNLIIPNKKKLSDEAVAAEKDTMVTLTSTINIIPDKGEDKKAEK